MVILLIYHNKTVMYNWNYLQLLILLILLDKWMKMRHHPVDFKFFPDKFKFTLPQNIFFFVICKNSSDVTPCHTQRTSPFGSAFLILKWTRWTENVYFYILRKLNDLKYWLVLLRPSSTPAARGKLQRWKMLKGLRWEFHHFYLSSFYMLKFVFKTHATAYLLLNSLEIFNIFVFFIRCF